MYSTLDGAKKRAKELKNLFDESGLIYPLAKCQQAVAMAGGFRDWHDLTTKVKGSVASRPPFDFWGRVLEMLPDPCRFPIECHVGGDPERGRQDIPASEKWLRDVLPYVISLEIVLRSNASLLRPGSGDGQRMRLELVSGLLINFTDYCEITPKLFPDTLSVVLPTDLATLVPNLVPHPRFAVSVAELTSAGIILTEENATTILAPEDPGLRAEINRRAQDWRRRKENQIEYIDMGPELSAALKWQSDIDRAHAGPKVPYDELEYRGVILKSRWSIAAEFESMKRVVDVIPEDIRMRVTSLWCDSKAEATYAFKIKLGMNYELLADHIQMCALEALGGYNGLMVSHGSQDRFFDPEWPGDEACLLGEDEPLVPANGVGLYDEINFDGVPF